MVLYFTVALSPPPTPMKGSFNNPKGVPTHRLRNTGTQGTKQKEVSGKIFAERADKRRNPQEASDLNWKYLQRS